MISAAGLRVLLVASGSFGLVACSGKAVTATINSPDQYYKAVVMVRTVGAKPVTEVMLEPQSVWHLGNHQLVWSGQVPPSEISVSWQGDNHLSVTYPQAANVTESRKLSMGVALEFSPLGSGPSIHSAVGAASSGV